MMFDLLLMIVAMLGISTLGHAIKRGITGPPPAPKAPDENHIDKVIAAHDPLLDEFAELERKVASRTKFRADLEAYKQQKMKGWQI